MLCDPSDVLKVVSMLNILPIDMRSEPPPTDFPPITPPSGWKGSLPHDESIKFEVGRFSLSSALVVITQYNLIIVT